VSKVGNDKAQINLRTVVHMDQEPMHLLQAMQGSIVVVTNDYLTRMANNFSEDDCETQVMMF